ncbi:YhcG family protein [Butyricimonas paravirosa]|uniref:PDDEXK nuclease domain-containing protein n=1 Tax=Butyricimonas paravirosa TaxID=1472417 RepID=UPI002A83AAAD|nr:PDDEXK nuclease domain-containing protein [Butyricimonas paravirosa]
MNFETLVEHISTIQCTLQAQAAHAVNLALTSRNWLMGCYIVEFEQNGEDRAAYGEQLLKKLEKRLNIKGLNERRFREFRRLYLIYPQLKQPITQYITSQIQNSLSTEFIEPIRQLSSAESIINIRRTPSAELTNNPKWIIPADKLFNKLTYSNLILIATIDNPIKRAFYEMETIRGCWSYKELERQITSLYYERSGLSQNKEALSALVQQQAILLQPKDVINTPVTLEFLGLNERALVTENDLEQSILDNLQRFLLEMGHGFCFEARQKRILIDEDYFFTDLVFYHRILKCHVIVELKIDKFRHEYASQLNMYLNYFKAEIMQPDDNPPIGILLCTEKGDTLVKYATAGLDPNIFVQKYMIELPSEEEIKKFISSSNY